MRFEVTFAGVVVFNVICCAENNIVCAGGADMEAERLKLLLILLLFELLFNLEPTFNGINVGVVDT